MVLKGCVHPRPKYNTHRAKRQKMVVAKCVDSEGSWPGFRSLPDHLLAV